MVKNLILSIIAIAILAGCSGKKDKTTEVMSWKQSPLKYKKLEKRISPEHWITPQIWKQINKFLRPCSHRKD